MFLTHKDDVADHGKWSKWLNCDRILHSKEVNSSTADVEIKLEGSGPWSLGDEIALIHTPGHTEGSVCLFYKPLKVLFTGDHLGIGESGLTIGERYNWFSVWGIPSHPQASAAAHANKHMRPSKICQKGGSDQVCTLRVTTVGLSGLSQCYISP